MPVVEQEHQIKEMVVLVAEQVTLMLVVEVQETHQVQVQVKEQMAEKE